MRQEEAIIHFLYKFDIDLELDQAIGYLLERDLHFTLMGMCNRSYFINAKHDTDRKTGMYIQNKRKGLLVSRCNIHKDHSNPKLLKKNRLNII